MTHGQELIEMLNELKNNAFDDGYRQMATVIDNCELPSFEFVINSAIEYIEDIESCRWPQ